MNRFLRRALRFSALFVVLAGGSAMAQEDTSTVRETHGDWQVRCQAEKQCYMQQVFNDANGQPLMLMRLRKLESPVARNGQSYVVEAELFMRLGYYLPAGIAMQVDEGKVSRIPFERCLPNGCGSLPLFTENMVNDLKNGGAANFSMVQSPESKVQAKISLSGFTAAYDAL